MRTDSTFRTRDKGVLLHDATVSDMRILTFGWDYPPATTGGLGVACQGLTEELLALGTEVIFVLPRSQRVQGNGTFLFATGNQSRAQVITVDARILPYHHAQSYIEIILSDGRKVRYGRTILEEVLRYSREARAIAADNAHDLIHAHDWTSYLAGLSAKEVSGKPLILHVHATSFDQAGGGNVDPDIYAIEREAFHKADAIIAVSQYTRSLVVERYGIDPAKVEVVHNGVRPASYVSLPPVLEELKAQGIRIVLYHGRITIQKGVDYFIRAARKVIETDSKIRFVISGSGDMERQIMQLVGELGLSQYVLFPGALWGEERDQLYRAADLMVMPSVSEPFGIVPLEALQQGTPTLISKQSGVAEVLTHTLKVDFWDVDEMANKILAALKYGAMHKQLREEGRRELSRLTWRHAAEKVAHVYRVIITKFREAIQ